jgi:hypothetical protein
MGSDCFKKPALPGASNPIQPMDPPTNLCDAYPAACVPACPQDGDVDECPNPGTILYPLIDPSANQEQYRDPTAKSPVSYERMWVNYHADRGNTRSDIRLLRDGEAAWNGDFATNYYAPKEPGPVHVWAVVHDNRGGEDWIHVPLLIQ